MSDNIEAPLDGATALSEAELINPQIEQELEEDKNRVKPVATV